jgi:uracil-DNA glycosylase family 4
MSFFFGTPPKPKSTGYKKNKIRIDPKHFARLGCTACPMNKLAHTLQSPKMLPTGSKRPDIYILGEAPGEREDRGNEQFIGPSGSYLRDRLPSELNYRFNNSIRCHPAGNRDPTDVELLCCLPKQFADIVATKPPVVLVFGAVALNALIGNAQITAIRGRAIAVHLAGHSFWLVASFHPAFLLRQGANKSWRGPSDTERCFVQDIELAASLVQAAPPSRYMFDDPNDGIELLTKVKDIVPALKLMAKEKRTATDIETNAIRPYIQEPKILTAAVSSHKRTIAFPIMHQEANFTTEQRNIVLGAYYEYLTSTTVWCHNAGFELEWFISEYGVETSYSYDLQDTMAQAFVLDERQRVLSLDDLCLFYFGINLKAMAELDKNNLASEPLDEVLLYNGRDSKYTVALSAEQEERLENEGLTQVYKMQNRRLPALTVAQFIGMRPNTKIVKGFSDKLAADIVRTEKAIQELPDVVSYRTKTGKPFNPISGPQLGAILISLGLIKQKKKGEKADENTKDDKADADEKVGTSEPVLAKLDHPLPKLVLELRGLEKLHSTYIKVLLPGGKHVHSDGKVHCNFNHLITSTGRLSSDSPNMQNYPKRGEGAQYRKVIRASTRRVILSMDHGQIEYRVIGMASKDKVIVRSLFDNFDVHLVWTEKLMRRFPRLVGGKQNFNDTKKVKELRSAVKNTWTFPAFYGSALDSIAASFGVAPNDLAPLFEEFWDEFHGVKSWQQDLIAGFEENNYVETLTGRRRHAPMSFNAAINSPIQGTASDIVVDGMERIGKYAIENDQLYMHPVLNVHDDLTFDFPADDEQFMEESIEFLAKQMLNCRFGFINVPLAVEVGIGPTWGEVEEVAKFTSTEFDIPIPAHKKARK